MVLRKNREVASEEKKNKEVRPKRKLCSVVDVSGGESKVRCCKEQYFTGTWNVQVGDGKSEHWYLGNQWTKVNRMRELNSDNCYIYYCGWESLRRNRVALIVNKRVWNAVLGCSLKNDRMIPVRFQGKPLNITGIQVYDSATKAKEAEVEWFYEDL